MKKFVLLQILGFFTLAAAISIAAQDMGAAKENKGAPHIVLFGGRTASVPFSHQIHQNILGDCNLCHKLFPKNSGAIQNLISGGKLQKKAVMARCRACHREMAGTGKNRTCQM